MELSSELELALQRLQADWETLRRALLDDGAAALGIVGVCGMGGIPRPSG